MSIIEAIILGLIQGLTEFLPVSSSGHIELGKVLLGVHPSDPLLFSVVVHAATALSTVVVFRKDLAATFTGLFNKEDASSRKFSIYIILSMIPAAIIGLKYNDLIEQLFDSNVLLVGSMLIVTAILLLFTDFAPKKDKPLTAVSAFIIGISQAIAILPGISRSGATISTAVLLGLNRFEAARFSFLMVVPLILGKMAKDLMDAKITSDTSMTVPLICGFLAAFVVGILACRWMIVLVRNSKLRYFAFYCLIVGAASLIIVNL